MRYKIPTPAAEGMAYISTPNWFSDKNPRLVVAGVKSSGRDHLGNTESDLFMDSFPRDSQRCKSISHAIL